MKNMTTSNTDMLSKGLLNPERLWAIEDELMSIPVQYRDIFWNELLAAYSDESAREREQKIVLA